MRKTTILTALLLILGFGTVAAQGTYGIDSAHSSVGFKVRHLVSKVSGGFNEFDGTIVADANNLDASSVEFTIKSASIYTKNEKRDGHLRSADFFDVEKYPEILNADELGYGNWWPFWSPEPFYAPQSDVSCMLSPETFERFIVPELDDTYAVAGTFTMHGVSKEITLTVDFLGEMSAMGGTRAGYELTTTLDRKDYEVSWNRALDAGGFVLGDEVEVSINLEVIKRDEK